MTANLQEFEISMSVLSGSGLLALFAFVAHEVKTSKNRSNWWKTAATPFNFSLVGFGASTLCGHVTAIVSHCPDGSLSNQSLFVNNIFLDLAVCGTSSSYMIYNWQRGKGVIEQVYPSLLRSFQLFSVYSPISFFALVITDNITRYNGTNGPIISDALLYLNLAVTLWIGIALLFDVFTVTVFVRYLNKTRLNDESMIDTRFQIISRYGIASSIFCLMSFFSSVATQITDGLLSDVLSTLMIFCMTVVFGIMFAMKVALDFDKKHSVNVHISGLTRVTAANTSEGSKKHSPTVRQGKLK